MKQPVQRRLAAILAADVAGYSRLMGADEEGTHERLKAHIGQVVDPKIGNWVLDIAELGSMSFPTGRRPQREEEFVLWKTERKTDTRTWRSLPR